jgi:DNA polymerase V
MSQAIALIDGNNFYVACEQSLDPSLVGIPVVVLSNNDGCIVARSPEARELGIPMGQPYFKVRYELEKLGVVVRSSNYALYGDMSNRFMKLLAQHSEKIEVYSIDEAFVQINRPPDSNLRPWARQLRALAHQNLGLPIAIGIGASKVQAKLANHLAKNISTHTGIFDLYTNKDQDFWLKTIAIENVWGIGPQLAKWCRIRGVNTAQELRDMPNNEIRNKLGVIGIRLQNELKGKACLPIQIISPPKQEVCVSRSFGRPVTNLRELRQAVSTHIVRASEKLRRQKQHAGAITVFTRTNPFKPSFYSQSATTQLEVASNDTSILLKASLPLTKQIFQPYRCLIKAGVIMQQLQNSDYLQTSLLCLYTPEELRRRQRLMNTIDQLNKRYGNGTIGWAACVPKPNWEMRREQLSYAQTTRIIEIPIVHS